MENNFQLNIELEDEFLSTWETHIRAFKQNKYFSILYYDTFLDFFPFIRNNFL
jgi:hypothetical protein